MKHLKTYENYEYQINEGFVDALKKMAAIGLLTTSMLMGNSSLAQQYNELDTKSKTEITDKVKMFQKTDLVDEFGDKLGEVQKNVAFGTFSNTATNESKLRVNTILAVVNSDLYNCKSLDEYKKIVTEQCKKNMSEKDIREMLKYINESIYQTIIQDMKNRNGVIEFELLEYEYHPVNFIEKNGTISIKTEEGKKISATFTLTNNQNKNSTSIILSGYREMTSGVKNLIKYGSYDWSQTEIYNEIANSKGEIKVVISVGTSTYKFTLK